MAAGTIYLYFRSKEQLLRGLVDELVRDLATRLSAALDPHCPRGARARFGAVWGTLLRFRRDRPGALELLLMQGDSSRARGEAVLGACPRLEQWLREAATEGAVVFSDAADAWALLSMICLAAPFKGRVEAEALPSEAAWRTAAWRAMSGTW